MELAVITLVSLLASGLTLISGFGLGTLLMPAFALFFPVGLAVAMTAVVHLANNLFKLVLLRRAADRGAVARFGLPAVAASFAGAKALVALSGMPPLLSYEAAGRALLVTPVNAVIAALLIVFALLELRPAGAGWMLPGRWLPLGGILSGFFGGLSGHQGALRSAFLLRAGLPKESFIATGVVIACLVDLTRLAVYGRALERVGLAENGTLLAAACASAFAGAFLGAKVMRAATMETVRRVVAGLLIVIALGLGSGWI